MRTLKGIALAKAVMKRDAFKAGMDDGLAGRAMNIPNTSPCNVLYEDAYAFAGWAAKAHNIAARAQLYRKTFANTFGTALLVSYWAAKDAA